MTTVSPFPTVSPRAPSYRFPVSLPLKGDGDGKRFGQS
jgi:hypothetical protein